MRLQKQLTLSQARLKDVKIELSDEDPRITLGVRASLTPEVAETFGCRDLVYVNNTPRSGVDKMALEGEEIDVDVRLENDNFSFSAMANSIGHYVAKFEGDGPKLEFRIKLTGYAGIVTDVAEKVKCDPLEVTLRPAQMELGLQHKDGAESDGEESEDDSERLISREQAADTAESDQDAATIAPAMVMGGTHQKGTRGRRKATPAPEPPTEEDDLMAELGVPEIVQ